MLWSTAISWQTSLWWNCDHWSLTKHYATALSALLSPKWVPNALRRVPSTLMPPKKDWRGFRVTSMKGLESSLWTWISVGTWYWSKPSELQTRLVNKLTYLGENWQPWKQPDILMKWHDTINGLRRKCSTVYWKLVRGDNSILHKTGTKKYSTSESK